MDALRTMASGLLQAKTGDSGVHVGKRWMERFLKRNGQLEIACSRALDNNRAKATHPGTIRRWFDLLASVITEYEILPEDIYNFDEKDVLMGMASGAKVITKITTAKDREVNNYRTLYHDLENVTTRAVDLLEAVVVANDTSDRNAAYEIARLKSIVAEEQHTSRQNREKLTRDISRLDSSVKEKDEAIANMGIETQKLTKKVKDLTNEAKKLGEERDGALKNGVDAEAADKATIAQLKVQVEEVIKQCEAAEANASREVREQMEAAEERALQAENRSAQAAELARISEENASQKQSTIDFLSVTLATNRTAFIEAVEKAKGAKEQAEKTAEVLKEQVAELVEEHKEKAARSTARNTKLKDELESEKKERLQFISSNENQRVKDAEEGRIRAEEAARRAKGEAEHLVRSQAGQLNRVKAMNDTYRARYGKLDEGSTANAKPQALNGTLNASSQVDDHSDTCPQLHALNGSLDASSPVDGRSDTCPRPGSSFDATLPSTASCFPSNQTGPGRKKPHRRGTRPRSSKKMSQTGEGLPTGTPTTESTTRGGDKA